MNNTNFQNIKSNYSSCVSNIITKLDDKSAIFDEEIKNKMKFNEKINQIYINEFKEKLTNILLMKELEFLTSINTAVKIILEEMYGPRVTEEKEIKEILKKNENIIKVEFYTPNMKILTSSWSEYETHLQAIKKYSTKAKISSKNKENFSFIKNFRKHCINTDSTGRHNCSDQSKLLAIRDESDQESTITHVICVECKKCFFYDCILLHCNYCKTDYYSSILAKDENPDIQPATWSKYHCEVLINDKMKCIKCRETFYLDLKTNLLVCLKPECKFEARPSFIAWSCQICKVEFRCEPKIYNPLEFKFIKDAIDQVLLIKQKARPLSVPCCRINIYSKTFFHKQECVGELFQGELNEKIIVVCEKCKSLNFYEKYVWTCPVCFKRFKLNVSGDEQAMNMNMNQNKNLIKSRHSDSGVSTPLKNKIMIISENNSNSKPLASTRSSLIEDYNTNIDVKQPESSAKKQAELKKISKPKKLCDILEERRIRKPSIVNSTQINDVSSDIRKNSKEEEFNRLNYLNSSISCVELNSTFEKEEESKKDSNFININNSKLITPEKKNIKDINGFSSTPSSAQGLQSLSIKNTSEEPSEQKKIQCQINKPLKLQNEVLVKNDKNIETADTESYSDSKKSKQISDDSTKLKEINISDYKIINQIGEGSYGKIYLTEDKFGGKFAMKKIIAHDLEEVKGFKQEFELVNSVRHSNVMRIYGICDKVLDTTTHAVYVIMEKAKNDWDVEVKNRLKLKKPYTEKELIIILKQLVAGLVYLQKLNISHRDLKPQNVLVFENNVYKVADFGEAKEIKIAKQLNTLRGTELYMSTILYEGLKANSSDVTHNSFKSDVFSLGYCFLYAATLTFTSLYDLRDLTNMKRITEVLERYLSNKYPNRIIRLLCKMVDVSEYNRLDFIGLENYLNANFSEYPA